MKTTTREGPSSPFVSSLDEDRVHALGVRVVALWGKPLDYAAGRVRDWALEFRGGLDWVERAVEGAEDSKTRLDSDGWIARRLIAWQAGGTVPPPRPEPTAPAERHWGGPTVPDPPPGYRYVPSQGNPMPRRAAYRLEPVPSRETPAPSTTEIAGALEALARATTPAERWAPETALKCWVREGYVDASALEGLDGPSRRMKKPAAGPATNFTRNRPQMSDSRGDSSLNAGSEQVSLGEPALRSALSGRVLMPCSQKPLTPLNPAVSDGS